MQIDASAPEWRNAGAVTTEAQTIEATSGAAERERVVVDLYLKKVDEDFFLDTAD